MHGDSLTIKNVHIKYKCQPNTKLYECVYVQLCSTAVVDVRQTSVEQYGPEMSDNVRLTLVEHQLFYRTTCTSSSTFVLNSKITDLSSK